MKILAIGTSGKNCTVAISEDDNLIKEINLTDGLTHSENLLPSIDKILNETSISLKDIDSYAVSIGPGSFTGIRIGISTIKGFCLGNDKPVIAVPSLLALAYAEKDFNGYVVPVIDAKNNNVYAGIYKKDSVNGSLCLIGEYISDNISCLTDLLVKLDDKFILVGDGAKIVADNLSANILGKPMKFEISSDLNIYEYASNIAKAGFDMYKQNLITTGVLLTPLYLKKSQAERELEAKS